MSQLFKDNDDLKHWKDFKREFYLITIAKQNLDISQNLVY